MNQPNSLMLPTGRKSNGEIFSLDILSSPNLFFSYSEFEQLEQIIKSISEINPSKGSLEFSLAMNSRYRPHFKKESESYKVVNTYFWDKPFRSTVENRPTFINTIYEEFKTRIKIKNKNKYYNPMLVIIDDIWNLILNQSKSIGQILFIGVNNGIGQNKCLGHIPCLLLFCCYCPCRVFVLYCLALACHVLSVLCLSLSFTLSCFSCLLLSCFV